MLQESTTMLNDGQATHYHKETNSESTIDQSLCSLDAASDFIQEVENDLHGSDHFPIKQTAKSVYHNTLEQDELKTGKLGLICRTTRSSGSK